MATIGGYITSFYMHELKTIKGIETSKNDALSEFYKVFRDY